MKGAGEKSSKLAKPSFVLLRKYRLVFGLIRCSFNPRLFFNRLLSLSRTRSRSIGPTVGASRNITFANWYFLIKVVGRFAFDYSFYVLYWRDSASRYIIRTKWLYRREYFGCNNWKYDSEGTSGIALETGKDALNSRFRERNLIEQRRAISGIKTNDTKPFRTPIMRAANSNCISFTNYSKRPLLLQRMKPIGIASFVDKITGRFSEGIAY